ncbi:hypothetical protein D3C83_07790 [compost metagenome]
MIAGMQCSELSHAAGFTRVVRRNNSLSSTGRLLAFGFIFVVSVGIAVAFAIIGAWPILPFAGLEMLVLCLAFRAIGRRAADYERIAIDGDRVRVEIREAGRERGHEFNRAWAQVVVSRGGAQLALRSHGREVEIGRHLNDGQRLVLARELERQLRGGGMTATTRTRT